MQAYSLPSPTMSQAESLGYIKTQQIFVGLSQNTFTITLQRLWRGGRARSYFKQFNFGQPNVLSQ